MLWSQAVRTANSNSRFEPDLPFVLVFGEERIVGAGVVCVAANDLGSWAAQAASLFAPPSNARDARALAVGALPFDHGRPAHLYRPAHVTFDRYLRTAIAPPARSGAPRRWRARAVPTRRDYERQVAALLPLLDDPAAALQKVVLARSLQIEADDRVDVATLFARLLLDPSVAAFQVPLPSASGAARTLVGATPELLIDKAGSSIASLPLAGSAPRAEDGAADRAAGERLRRSAKDAREHAVVVEWIADQLTPYCRTLSVPAIPSLISTHTMWHLASHIEGELRDADISSVELAEILHPTPAVCGVPLTRALEEIGRIEQFDRGFFAGSIGWCDDRGDGRWLMTLRCADVTDSLATLYAGAGIVSGSEPVAEGAETSAKFAAMLDALDVDEPLRAALVDGA